MAGKTGGGRKRKPYERRVVEGNFRPDRHGVSPATGGQFPDPPARLTDLERELWLELPRPSWIAESDVVALTALVSLYAKILEIRKKQAEKWRLTYVTQEGQLWGRLLGALSLLGLTPADRSKVAPTRPNVQATDDKWAGIL